MQSQYGGKFRYSAPEHGSSSIIHSRNEAFSNLSYISFFHIFAVSEVTKFLSLCILSFRHGHSVAEPGKSNTFKELLGKPSAIFSIISL